MSSPENSEAVALNFSSASTITMEILSVATFTSSAVTYTLSYASGVFPEFGVSMGSFSEILSPSKHIFILW